MTDSWNNKPRKIAVTRATTERTWDMQVVGQDAYGKPVFDDADMTADEMLDWLMMGTLKPADVPADAQPVLIELMIERLRKAGNDLLQYGQ